MEGERKRGGAGGEGRGGAGRGKGQGEREGEGRRGRAGEKGTAREMRGGAGRAGQGRAGQGRAGQGRARGRVGKTHPLMSTGRISCCTRVLFLMLATASDSGVTACIPTSSHVKTSKAKACCKEMQNADSRAQWKVQHR